MIDMTESLEERFKRFGRAVPHAEFIDDLPLTDQQRRAKKADFFFNDRAIVCEMKSLITDVSPKAERLMEPHRDRPEFPGFYGKWPIEEILKRLPDGEAIKREMYDVVTSGIADLVGEANRQIRKTKEVFETPDARGILLILNDSVNILDPRLVAHRVAQTLMKRDATGAPRYSEIHSVWIIGETHRVRVSTQLDGIPGIIMAHPLIPDDAAMAFLDEIQKPWADFTGLPLVELPEGTYETLQYRDDSQDIEAQRTTISDLWRREYRTRPYLAELSHDELLLYGARLSVEMVFVMRNAMATRLTNLRAMRRWAELNEETNRRHIDIGRVRQLADKEGMYYEETQEFWERTKLLADACDTIVDK